MEEVTIRGYSDDNVVVEGGKHTDEWGSFDTESHVIFSTGDRFTVSFDEGVWRIEHADVSPFKLEVSIKKAPPDDEDAYTDVATVKGEFKWVDCWSSWPPDREQIMERFEEKEILRGLDDNQLLAIYEAALGRV
jgi:hypothetical protein